MLTFKVIVCKISNPQTPREPDLLDSQRFARFPLQRLFTLMFIASVALTFSEIKNINMILCG